MRSHPLSLVATLSVIVQLGTAQSGGASLRTLAHRCTATLALLCMEDRHIEYSCISVQAKEDGPWAKLKI